MPEQKNVSLSLMDESIVLDGKPAGCRFLQILQKSAGMAVDSQVVLTSVTYLSCLHLIIPLCLQTQHMHTNSHGPETTSVLATPRKMTSCWLDKCCPA